MDELVQEKERIISSIMQVDAQLACLNKRSPGRAELIKQKSILVFELKKVKRTLQGAWGRSNKSQDNECPITDHALVRWLERKHRIDTHGLKASMLCESLRSAITSNQKYWSDGDVVFVIDNGMVQTVIPVTNLREIAA